MAEYEVLLNDLETQKAQLELERGYKLTKKDLLVFIEELLKGDVNDKDYQKQIIDHLVSQVFVSDDNTVVYFNIRGGKDIEKLTIDDTKEVVEKVQTQSPLARQRKTKSDTRVFDLGFSFAKIQVLSAFFICRRAVILRLSVFVWVCSYRFIRSSCRRFYAAKGSWATKRSVSGYWAKSLMYAIASSSISSILSGWF